jgi:hypothetical protein
MLIDELLHNPMLAQIGFLSQDLRGRLSKATKFVLRRDFAMAADEFSTGTDFLPVVDRLNRVLPLARLPFPECWCEVAHADRHYFATSPFLEPTDGTPARIGWLLTQVDQRGVWSAQMFWSFAASQVGFMGRHLPPVTSGLMMVIDPHQADVVAATSLQPVAVHPIINRWGTNQNDWAGEPGFLIATLALMNSRNAAETQPTEPNNKRRKLTGKPLLFSYHLVCIPQRYKQRHIAAADDDPRQLRAHFVRGHFKLRKSGLFFWSAYQRGNPALGFVHKDYMVGVLRTGAEPHHAL